MQSSFYSRWLPALLLWLGTALAAQASHVLATEITYAPVASTTAGTPRYHVALRLYIDVSSPQLAAQPTATMTFSRNGCDAIGTGSFSVTIPVTQVLKTYGQSCPGGGPVYRVQLHETDVDLPRGQWTLSFAGENRSIGIKNFYDSTTGTYGIYCSAFLNTELVAQNTSPVFLTTRLPYVASGQAARYSFSAFDADGDSLVYRFVQPQEGVSPRYVCGANIPSTLSPHFQLDAATGALTAPAATGDVGRYVMAARVDEYRRLNGSWQQIGWVMRDVSYVFLNVTNRAPSFTALTIAGAPAAQPVGGLIWVRAGQTVVLALDAADPDAGQTLSFASDAAGFVPGLSLQPLGPTRTQLTWQVPAALPPGRYTATVAVTDDGCPSASEEQTLAFLVAAATPLATRPAPDAKSAAFPTPFREQVQFQAAAGQAVTIVDELGRVVAQLRPQADGRVVWRPAATLPAGLYVARGADGRSLARLLRGPGTDY